MGPGTANSPKENLTNTILPTLFNILTCAYNAENQLNSL